MSITFIPPSGTILERRICPVSHREFVITDEDKEMLGKLTPVVGGEKLDLPFPTLHPQERQIRRMIWRNYDQLYKNICAITGQQVITTYRPNTSYQVITSEQWWSDAWNPADFGKKIDFDRPFFDQFYELDQNVYHLPISFSKSTNSAYTNFSINNKNCYLCSRVAECEDCLYSFLIVNCKNCVDCSDVDSSEYLYECVRTKQSYNCSFCTDCDNCQDCAFLKDCSNCHHCFGSCNLRNKSYVYNNQQLSEAEYKEKVKKSRLSDLDVIALRTRFLTFSEKFPKRYIIGFNNENCVGNYLYNNKNVMWWFDCHYSEDVRYSYGAHKIKTGMDVSFWYHHEFSYEVCGWTEANNTLFCINCLEGSHDLMYCKDCVNTSHNCFGCISTKKARNCILNTAYSQQEYEKQVHKLVDHMRSTGEWWEFFPSKYSPYAYNESTAQVHFPHDQTWVENRNLQWYIWDTSIENGTPKWELLPLDQYDEKKVWYDIAKHNIDILLWSSFECEESHKRYNIIPKELLFYLEHSLPLPKYHPRVRFQHRSELTLPMELYNRTCHECHKNILTPYSPERPEPVLCEECYWKLMY